MKRASSSSSSILAVAGRPRGRRTSAIVIGVGLAAFALGACGGGDDESEDTTPESTISLATTTTAVTTTTTPPSTTAAVPDEPEYVTEGAIVIVANSSNVNGAAGRMSDRLAAVGFEMGTATNGTEGQLEVTKIYYDPANENALPVAESLREALGGGDIQVFEVGVPAPVDGGSAGDATVIVSMGNDTADKTLEQLQGRAPATTSADSGDDTTDTTEGSTDTTEPSTDTTEAG